MKRVYIVCLFVCILNANNIFSQTAETIDFKDVTFNEALALAKGSNKLVFIHPGVLLVKKWTKLYL